MKKQFLNATLVVLVVLAFVCLFSSNALAANQLSRTLRIGMSGDDVSVVQQLLKERGFYTYSNITGYFGNGTLKSVKAFQEANGLVADGIIGPATRSVMNNILSGGSASSRGDGSGTYYTVKSGDSLWKISQKYNVSLDKLLAANNMNGSTVIYPGQKIVIPQGASKSSASAPSQPGVTYIIHTITSGDTLWNLSYRYGVSMEDIEKANGITDSTILINGQKLKIPQYNIPVKPTPGPKYGELLDWWTEATYVFPLNAEALVTDFYTGISFKVKRTYGANHADVEPLTASDTNILKGIWAKNEKLWDGSVNYWARRPVIVNINGRKIAASATAMLHAGVDSAPEGAYVNWRSGDYGAGYNYDKVKGNGADGHFDIHFLNSTRHKDGLIDNEHQAMVKIAAGK